MNPFGHLGFALAGGYAAERALLSAWAMPRVAALGRVLPAPRIDLRVVAFGALLPDLLDKPLSLWVWEDIGTRSIGHTALFSLILLAIGLIVLGLARRWEGVVLALASMSHLALDQMWTLPGTLVWPLAGPRFPAAYETGWSYFLWRGLGSEGTTGDALGLLLLILLAAGLAGAWIWRQVTRAGSRQM